VRAPVVPAVRGQFIAPGHWRFGRYYGVRVGGGQWEVWQGGYVVAVVGGLEEVREWVQGR
jgi:hypothetical protein